MFDKLKELSKDTAIYGVSTMVGRFLTFLLVPFYTHVFSNFDYGIVSNLYIFIAILNVIFIYGMDAAYLKYAAIPSEKGDKDNFSTPYLSVFGVGGVGALSFAGADALSSARGMGQAAGIGSAAGGADAAREGGDSVCASGTGHAVAEAVGLRMEWGGGRGRGENGRRHDLGSLAVVGRHIGAPVAENTAIFHRQDAVGMDNDTRVVADTQHRGAMRMGDPVQDVDDHLAIGGVQRAGRFIGKQQLRFLGQRTGDRHALLLATGQFGRTQLHARCHADFFQ